MKKAWKSQVTAGAVSLIAAAVAHAAGDAKPATSDQLEEVTISTRYAAEESQKTPLAISTVTADMIEARGITQVSDMSASLPNVTFVQSGQNYGKSVTAFVRGIGQVDSSFAFNPAVGIYLDDVYVGAMTGSNLDLVDIESVDVLRGPQGTLFGSGSEGGTVRYIMNQPSLTTESTYVRSELSYTQGGQPNGELGVAHGGPLVGVQGRPHRL